MGTTMMPPFRTARTTRDQAIAALGEANRVRLRRASLMRWPYGQSSAQSHERAAELTVDPDAALSSMFVLELLGRVRQVGPRKRSACSPAPTSPHVHRRRDDPEAARRACRAPTPPRRSALARD